MTRIIFHLQVGDVNFNPTGDELIEAMLEFQKESPRYGVPVTVTRLEIMPNHERLVIVASAPDWSPTEGELDDLVTMFKNVVKDEKGGTVATRHGVTVTVVPKMR